MSAASHKSVVVCDLEGRIESFNDGAEQIFGWRRDEVVGKRRVSLFSPGLVVLQHVPAWLKTATETGEMRTRTAFVRKDGTQFAAELRITPTRSRGEHIGYCGVTVPLPDVDVSEVSPAIRLSTRVVRWLVVTRAPFLTATLLPILIAAAWLVARGLTPFPWLPFALALVGGLALHVAANTFNDYYDWQSGTDQANNDYLMPFSGGSRSLELGLITEQGLLRLAMAALAVAAAAGGALLFVRGPALVLFGLAGAFSAFFYTAPPLRLAARRGLGELLVGLNFGPLMTGGTAFALAGRVGWEDFAIGLPIGLLTTAILWVNEFPDAPSDALTGKNHLVVTLGRRAARWGYALLLVGAFALLAAGVVVGLVPPLALLAMLTAPLGAYATAILFQHYEGRQLVAASSATIKLHAAAGALMALGLLLAG